MAKKKVELLITTTFTKYVEYECEEHESEHDILERAYADTDMLDNALDNAEIETEISIEK